MELITTHVCKASDIGVNDNLFGGTMLAWLDESGGIFSCNKCNSPRMVTVMVDKVIFKHPVKVGNLIKIYGEVNKIGRTSISISLEARRFNFDKYCKETVVCSTDMVFVKIDENGKSIEI